MIEIDSLVSRTQYLMGIAHCLDTTDTTRNCHWSINSNSLTTDYKVVMRMCHVVPVCGDNGTSGEWCMCGVPALTGAVVRTLEPPSAVTVKWSPTPAPAPACALLCPCARTRVKISPQHRVRLMVRMGYIIQSVYTLHWVRETTK